MSKSRSKRSSLEAGLEPGWLEADLNPLPEFISSPDPQREKIQDLQDHGKIHYYPDNGKIRDYADEEKIPTYDVNEVADRELLPLPSGAITICGLRRWLFWTACGIAVFLILAAAAGGSAGGVLSHQHKSAPPMLVSNVTNTTHEKTSPILQNSKLTSLYYMDESNITHYRVYFQNRTGILQESAWDSNSTTWTVTDISDQLDDVQLGTPLACACGYPHAMKNYTFVCLS